MDFSCPIFFFLIFNLCVCVCVCTPTVSFFVSSARFPSLLSNPILFFLFFLQCFILFRRIRQLLLEPGRTLTGLDGLTPTTNVPVSRVPTSMRRVHT